MKTIQFLTFVTALAVLPSAIAKADSAVTPDNSDKPACSASGEKCQCQQAHKACYYSWRTVAILQELPIPGKEVFVRKEPEIDTPTSLRLYKVIATNSSSVSVGSVIIVETGYDPRFSKSSPGGYSILDLTTHLPIKVDNDRVTYYFADNATCIGISNDTANLFISKMSENK